MKNNSLSSLPDVLKELICLKTLDLESNYLETLDMHLLPSSLLEINASHNQIKKVHVSTNLPNFNKLNLNFNNLMNLPSEIDSLNQLERLYCDYNLLNSLPETIGKLYHLKQLHLNGNNIKTLPDSIFQSDSLEILAIDVQKVDSQKEALDLFIKRGGQIISPPFIIRVFFEYDGNHFWSVNDETEEKFGSPIKSTSLPLSVKLIEEFKSLNSKWVYIMEKKLQQEKTLFISDLRRTLILAKDELGDNYVLKCKIDDIFI